MIMDHLAFKATKALGYDTYISWNRLKGTFFINSFNPNLGDIVKKLNEVAPGCTTDVRGVMVFGKINNLTEQQFLKIIGPNIKKEIEPREKVVVKKVGKKED